MTMLVLVGLTMVVPGSSSDFLEDIVDSVLVAPHGTAWLRPLLIAMTGPPLVLRFLIGGWQQRYIARLQTKLLVTTSTEFFSTLCTCPSSSSPSGTRRHLESGRNQRSGRVVHFRDGCDGGDHAVLDRVFFALLMLAYSGRSRWIGLVVVAIIVGVTPLRGQHSEGRQQAGCCRSKARCRASRWAG